ncbi:hypothetical protein ACFL1H_07060 [Nanoarchaeota archaeon]
MSKSIQCINIKVNPKQQVFSPKSIYFQLHEWAIENGFAIRGKGDADFPETFYMHKPTGGGLEVWWWWRLEKKAPSPLFKYELKIDAHILTLKDTEVMAGDKKIKTKQGEIEVAAKGKVIFDPDNKIKKHWLWKYFYTMLTDRVYKKDIDYHALRFNRVGSTLHEMLKSFFKLPTFGKKGTTEGSRVFPKFDETF